MRNLRLTVLNPLHKVIQLAGGPGLLKDKGSSLWKSAKLLYHLGYVYGRLGRSDLTAEYLCKRTSPTVVKNPFCSQTKVRRIPTERIPIRRKSVFIDI